MPRFYQEKRLKPLHLQMIRLRWLGYDNTEIAQRTGFTPEQISKVLASPDSKAIFEELQAAVLDTTVEVSQELQLAAPLAAKRMTDLLVSGDDRVAFVAAKEILHMAGHTPVKRIAIAQVTRVEKTYEGLDEQQMRQKILEDLTEEFNSPPPGTVIN
jgi:hypothetical protein